MIYVNLFPDVDVLIKTMTEGEAFFPEAGPPQEGRRFSIVLHQYSQQVMRSWVESGGRSDTNKATRPRCDRTRGNRCASGEPGWRQSRIHTRLTIAPDGISATLFFVTTGSGRMLAERTHE
jgi:hypothetical protein